MTEDRGTQLGGTKTFQTPAQAIDVARDRSSIGSSSRSQEIIASAWSSHIRQIAGLSGADNAASQKGRVRRPPRPLFAHLRRLSDVSSRRQAVVAGRYGGRRSWGDRTFRAMQVSPDQRQRPAAQPPQLLARGTLRPQPQGRASKTMLNGVSVALRTLPNPPCVIADDSLAKPACAPNAAPTG